MRVFNNYFKVYDDTSIMQIADEMDLEPWELGQILIRISIHLYKELGKEQISSLGNNQTEIDKEHVREMVVKEREQISEKD